MAHAKLVPVPDSASGSSRSGDRSALVWSVAAVLAIIAAVVGLWLVPAVVAAVAAVRVRQGRRLRSVAARRCAAAASVNRLSPDLGEELTTGDLAAIAGTTRVIDEATTAVGSMHDPWRRLLAEDRLSVARHRIRSGALFPVVALYGMAGTAMGVGAVGYVVTGSAWWSLGSVAAAIPAALAVDETRWRRRVALVVAERAAADPITGRPPTEDELVSLVRWIAAGHPGVLSLAARTAATSDTAHQRLIAAAEGSGT